ncbi:Hypothetical predicted protein [Olea europaea subsp. europaea]|uniref:Uncharacterized protein n=1 Tax=Olea europaea subsp. europaea TaxID=158383 RepID=A0A8S0QNE9_OLEEU|nr:Hypothetical predicted protein [Olea europaea subsp. europaea]
MSTDEEFSLEVRFPMLKIKNEHDQSGIIINGEEYCGTPKSPEYTNTIPEALNCLPAPRKPKSALSCKRKLYYELEMVSSEETESLFRIFEANFNGAGATKKRRCSVLK